MQRDRTTGDSTIDISSLSPSNRRRIEHEYYNQENHHDEHQNVSRLRGLSWFINGLFFVTDMAGGIIRCIHLIKNYKDEDLFIDPLPLIITPKQDINTITLFNGCKFDYLAIRIITKNPSINISPQYIFLPPRDRIMVNITIDDTDNNNNQDDLTNDEKNNVLLIEYYNPTIRMVQNPRKLWRNPLIPSKWKFKFVFIHFEKEHQLL